jgi:ATP-binding cassette subfamily C protein CydC
VNGLDRTGLRRDPLWRGLRALSLNPWRVAAAVAFGTGALGCAIALMAVSAWLIARAAQQPPIMYLSIAVVATRAFGLGRGVLRYCERLAGHDLALRGAVRLRERLYERLAAGDAAVVAGLHRGDLLARVGADAEALADVVVRGLLPFAVVWLTVLLTVAGLAFALPSTALAVLTGAIVATVLAPWLVARATLALQRQTAATRSAVSAETLALLDGVEELAVAGIAGLRLDRIAELEQESAALADRATRPSAWASGASTLATAGAAVLALVLACAATGAGQLSPVTLAVVALTSLAVAEAGAGLPAAAVAVVGGRAAAERLVPLLDLPATTPIATAVIEAGEPELLTARGVAAGWPGRPAVRTDVSLRLRPGELLAIGGPSGSGKTTLLLTLAGLLRPQAGDVASAGRALFTGEDAHVFATTLRENLRLADPGADDATLVEALDGAGLGAWFSGLSDGLDTMLGSGGHNVSGGERRRLLVARALLSPARVLLFDEPAEHLDPATADQLLADLRALAEADRRGIVIAVHDPGIRTRTDRTGPRPEPAPARAAPR